MSCSDLSQRTYYLSPDGNDANAGDRTKPWKSLAHLSSVDLEPGDTVYLMGGSSFEGTLRLDSSDCGTGNHPVVLTSYGKGKAIIRSGNASGIVADHAAWITLMNLSVKGSGRKEGNTENGVALLHCTNTNVDSLDISGYQKSGLLVYSSSHVVINGVLAAENGFAGISISGENSKSDCSYITVLNARAQNNPGDPTNLTNHSGNGIIAGFCSHVLIAYCTATENGWDMPRRGNGPVGIWTYESDSVVIEHCISYNNKTSEGAEDGGGFDLDGGVTNSVIQYCLTYNNAGSGFGVFQYDGASPWRNNTIRFNISVDDGLVSSAHAGIYVWNGSGQADQLLDCYVYNNTIVNRPGAVLHYHDDSRRIGFHFYNNLFVSRDKDIVGEAGSDEFMGNDWWSRMGRPARQTMDNRFDPQFDDGDSVAVMNPRKLPTFNKFSVPVSSPLRVLGVDLRTKFGIDPGQQDFKNKPFPSQGIGASF